MNTMKKILSLLLALALCLSACALAQTATGTLTLDREGNEITLPEEVATIASLSPATTQVIMDLGLTDKLVAVDTYSAQYWPELGELELPLFDMYMPDAEQLTLLSPDLILVSSMSSYYGGDALSALVDLGICVAAIPSSATVADAEEDVRFIASCVGAEEAGEQLVADMEATIADVTAIASTITEKKTVLFEIGCLPDIYSVGEGTYLHELIGMAGGINVLGDQQGWLAVSEEDALAANPDVILTDVNYIDDPVGEILGREGWDVVTAVAEQQVFYIDNLACSLPNNHITDALVEIALALYPDEFAPLKAE